MDYREEDRPMIIRLPEGMDTSKLFKFNPGPCDTPECGYRAIGSCYNGGTRESGSYCGVHKAETLQRVIGRQGGLDEID